jgi:hypothetical protein
MGLLEVEEPGEKVGAAAWMVYVAVETGLGVMLVPAAIALRVVVVDTLTVHVVEQELDDVLGVLPLVV